MQRISVRSEEDSSYGTRISFIARGLQDDSLQSRYECPPELITCCSVLGSLASIPGESQLRQVNIESFRLWLNGVNSSYKGSNYRALLGAVEWADFLGDERLISWIQIGVTVIRRLGSSGSPIPEEYIRCTEDLSPDLLDLFLAEMPLVITLEHFSKPSHSKAVRTRIVDEEDGPHLNLELPASLNPSTASDLEEAIADIVVTPTSITLRPGDQRNFMSTVSFPSGVSFDEAWMGGSGPASDNLEVQPAFQYVAEVLGRITGVKRICCSRCSISPKTLQSFAGQDLQVLDASENDLGQRFSRLSCPSKRNFDACLLFGTSTINTTLQELNLASNYLDAAMLPAYVAGVPHTKQYTAWNAPIQAAFSRLQGLQSLNLSCNNLTASNIVTLLCPAPACSPRSTGAAPVTSPHAWSPFAQTLKSLDINSNTLTPPSPLVGVLMHLTLLTRLSVADSALRTADMFEIAPSFMRMRNMRWLSIGKNRITARAGTVLARALRCMTDLQRLDASGHIMFQLGPEGITELAGALRQLPSLEHLDLRKQHMGGDGAVALTSALSCLSRLSCLDLDTNSLDSCGAEALATCIAHSGLQRLRVLGISDNKLTDSALNVLAPQLVELPHLQRVRLDNNKLVHWSGDWGCGHVDKKTLQRWLHCGSEDVIQPPLPSSPIFSQAG